MNKAWDITAGSNNIKVAVIGGGVNYNHEDLINQLNTDYKGWNYATGTENPVAYHYHETRCAGIIAASTNNDLGIAGIAGGWNGNGIKMMYFQCCPDHYSSPTSANIADAFSKARINEAKVISMSLSDMPYLPAIFTEITAAINAGIVICISSGNYLRYQDEKTHQWIEEEPDVQYPATHPDVIAVGATIEDDHRKTLTAETDWGSCYGPELDIVAPGINILTTDLQSYSGEKYTFSLPFLGTSAATPHVAGVVALILSLQPNIPSGSIQTVNAIKAILQSSTDWQSFMNPAEYSSGRLNAYKALKYTLENYGGTLTQI